MVGDALILVVVVVAFAGGVAEPLEAPAEMEGFVGFDLAGQKGSEAVLARYRE